MHTLSRWFPSSFFCILSLFFHCWFGGEALQDETIRPIWQQECPDSSDGQNWTRLGLWLNLDAKQPYTFIFIDCDTKYFLIPRTLPLIWKSFQRGTSYVCMTLILSYLLFEICNNIRSSGVLEVSYDQNHGKATRVAQKTITIFHKDSSRSRCF